MQRLRFTCLPGCTKCCQAPGYVYLTEEDLRRAAAAVSLRPGAFEKRFVYRTRNFLRLRKPRDSECRFLTEHGCRLHPAKPTQCRTFPFWPELIGEPGAWQETAGYCPGIGRGPLITIEAAIRVANEMVEGYPAMYEKLRARKRSPAAGRCGTTSG
jgi:Fe-S-cluster containining protein